MLDFKMRLGKYFTDAEKENCIPIIRKIRNLAIEARKNSILSLEAGLKDEPDIFLRTGLQLAVFATDPKDIKQTLQYLILADDYSGAELLKRLLLTEGILCIVNGLNPRQTTMYLLAMLGEKYITRIDEFRTNIDVYAELLQKYKDKKPSPDSSNFEETILSLNNLTMTNLMRECTPNNLALAIYGCSLEAILRVLGNMSKYSCQYICGFLVKWDPVLGETNLQEITDAQNIISEKINELKIKGIIV